MNEPITYTMIVKAEESHKYPDMQLRLFIRQAVLSLTNNDLDLDEALSILKDESDYLEHRIKGVNR